jgi:hypothetical protein
MINDIKEYFRYRLYNNCNILVNNLNDVISEVSMFLDKKVYKFLEDIDDCKGIIVCGILIELKDNEISWRILEKGETIPGMILELTKENILDIFKDDEHVNKLKETFENYPKELYGLSFISFMETMEYFLMLDDLIEEEINVFDICKLYSNTINNIIYRG